MFGGTLGTLATPGRLGRLATLGRLGTLQKHRQLQVFDVFRLASTISMFSDNYEVFRRFSAFFSLQFASFFDLSSW